MDDMVATCKQGAVSGMETFLKTFSFVQDDRLNWTPAATAKTPLQIAAHAACTAGNFALLYRDGKFPPVEAGKFMEYMKQAESVVTTREQAVELLKKNTADLVAALDTMTPEKIALTVDTPFGFAAPMSMFMMVPGVHARNHAAQIDYLQTCWGDQDVHF